MGPFTWIAGSPPGRRSGWRGGEIELLGGDAVVTGAAESQRPLEVQQLAHEVEVGGDVGFLHLHNVISIIHRQVELLHKISHSHSDRAADAGQAMHQDTTIFAPGFIYERNGLRENWDRFWLQ